MKLNLKRTLLVLVLMAAAFPVGLKYGCLIKNVFGIECPSCGVSRAWLALLKGDIVGAFGYHPMFWCPPFLILCLCRDKYIVGKAFDITIMCILLAAYFAVYFVTKL